MTRSCPTMTLPSSARISARAVRSSRRAFSSAPEASCPVDFAANSSIFSRRYRFQLWLGKGKLLPHKPRMSCKWLALWSLASLGVLLALGLRFARWKDSRWANLLLAGCAAALTFWALEWSFYFWITPSDGFAMTLSGQRWFQRYWPPLNQLGYRDIDHPPSERKKLFVIGDSFVAGHGINYAGDRFSNLLGERLGNDWEVFNIAQCGWGTPTEFAALKSHPTKPNAVVWVYFPNDIELSALLEGKSLPEFRPLAPLPARKSYLLNFLYWRYARSRMQHVQTDYWQFINESYKNPTILARQIQQLQELVNYSHDQSIALLVVFFPHLPMIDWSRKAVEPLRNYFETQHIPTLDLGERLAGRDLKTLTVNNNDAHARQSLQPELAAWIEESLRPILSAPH